MNHIHIFLAIQVQLVTYIGGNDGGFAKENGRLLQKATTNLENYSGANILTTFVSLEVGDVEMKFVQMRHLRSP